MTGRRLDAKYTKRLEDDKGKTTMPSLSSKTRVKRNAKLKKAGRRRKRLMRRGSTPSFPIHLDKAEEKEKKTDQSSSSSS